MKVIKSNSINFSKYCNFGEISNDKNPEEEINKIIGDAKPAEPVTEQPNTAAQEATLERFNTQEQIKNAQAELDKAERNQQFENRVADQGAAAKALGADKETLNEEDIHRGQMEALRGPEVADHFEKMENRGQFGDFVDEGASKALSVGKGAASALGGLLSKFDKTKDAGKSLKDKVKNFDPEYAGTTAGNWADEHKVAAGAIGAGALLGAGLLAKKGYDLMKGKKELQANAFYAFDSSDVNKSSLIGGPYATRKDAREAHPEAAHILKGSTLGSYGDFEVAS